MKHRCWIGSLRAIMLVPVVLILIGRSQLHNSGIPGVPG